MTYCRTLTRVHWQGEDGLGRSFGRGARGCEILVAAVLDSDLAAALWWAYFDLCILSAHRRLSAARGKERARPVLEAYSYLHLPMFAGIFFAALGILALLLCGLAIFETATSRECRRELHAR